MIVSASIVVYNEDEKTLKKAIESFLNLDVDKELIVVDNSMSDKLRSFCENFFDIQYIYAGKNIGFGAGHNLAFKSLKKNTDIHIIINPDVYFHSDIKNYLEWMYNSKDVSLSVPYVFFPDRSYQSTIRKLPSVFTLIKRRMNIRLDEFNEDSFSDISDIPFAHGCFLAFKTDVYRSLYGFDERFFMYMEDVDIFIRAKKFGRTVVNPNYKIYHEYRKGSSVNKKLLFFHINSAIKFFLKYPRLIF